MLTPGWGTGTRGGSPPGVKLGSLPVFAECPWHSAKPMSPVVLGVGSLVFYKLWFLKSTSEQSKYFVKTKKSHIMFFIWFVIHGFHPKFEEPIE